MVLSRRQKCALILFGYLASLQLDNVARLYDPDIGYIALVPFVVGFLAVRLIADRIQWEPKYMRVRVSLTFLALIFLSLISSTVIGPQLFPSSHHVASIFGGLGATLVFLPVFFRYYLHSELWVGGDFVTQKQLLKESKQFRRGELNN